MSLVALAFGSGVVLYVGIQHLLVALRRGGHSGALAFAVFGFSLFAFSLALGVMYSAPDAATYAVWAPVRYGATFLMAPALAWYAWAQTGEESRRMPLAITVGAAAVFVLFVGSGGLDYTGATLTRLELPWGETLADARPLVSRLGVVFLILVVVTIGYLVTCARTSWSRGRHGRAAVLGTALIGPVLAGGYFAVSLSHRLPPAPIMDFGAIPFVLASGFLLAREQTERERREVAVARSEAQFRTVIEHAPEAIVIVDASTLEVPWANSAAQALLAPEGEPEQLARMSVLDVLPPRQYGGEESRSIVLDRVRDAVSGGVQRFDLTIRAIDGTTFDAEVRVVPMLGSERPLLRVSLLDLRPRRERRRIEREMRIRRRHAARLRSVGEVTGGVAHDFNNMLSVVGSNLELVADHLPPGDPSGPMIAEAEEAVERCSALARGILSFSSPRPARPEVIDLRAMEVPLVDLLERSLGGATRVALHIADDLWPIFVDRAGLENALISIAMNGRDAMERGGDLMVTAANTRVRRPPTPPLERPGNYVRISIVDGGTGMEPEVVERAFEPFFTTRGEQGASGLGLSTVYGFARQAGGAATIDSEPGLGTTVSLFFPRHLPADRMGGGA